MALAAIVHCRSRLVPDPGASLMVVPSQIVRLVREHYPQLADHTNLASAPEAGFLAGVIAAVRQLPDGIVPADMATRFAATIGSIEAAIQSCAPDPRRGHLTGRHVSELLALLAAFPDEPFRPDDNALQFIDDEAFRRTLSVDIAAGSPSAVKGRMESRYGAGGVSYRGRVSMDNPPRSCRRCRGDSSPSPTRGTAWCAWCPE